MTEPMEKEKTTSCPFCQESDFDLAGLKSHLKNHCEIYAETIDLPTLFHSATPKDTPHAH